MQADRQTQIYEADRQRDGHGCRQTDRHRDRHAHTQMTVAKTGYWY